MFLSCSLTTLPGRSRRGLNLRVCCESHLSSATIPHCSPVYQNHLSTKVTCLLSRHSMLGEPEKCCSQWTAGFSVKIVWQMGCDRRHEKSLLQVKCFNCRIPIIFIMMVSLDCRQVTQCSFFGLQKLFRRRNIALVQSTPNKSLQCCQVSAVRAACFMLRGALSSCLCNFWIFIARFSGISCSAILDISFFSSIGPTLSVFLLNQQCQWNTE